MLTFGGADASLYTGDLSYAPLTKTWPASAYWGVDQAITYGDGAEQVLKAGSAGIVDSGTTMILIASGASLILATTLPFSVAVN